jgi:hypothetical protein
VRETEREGERQRERERERESLYRLARYGRSVKISNLDGFVPIGAYRPIIDFDDPVTNFTLFTLFY